MSYIRSVRPQQPKEFCTNISVISLRFKEPGVAILNCQQRHISTHSRMEPLPELKYFNYRSPDPVKKSNVPKIDDKHFVSTFLNESRVKSNLQKDPFYNIDSPQSKSPTRYLGVTAYQHDYKPIVEIPEEEFQQVQCSKGTQMSITGRFRNQCQVIYKHDGVYEEIKQYDGQYEKQWSCCGNSDQNNQGCIKIKLHPGKTTYCQPESSVFY